MKKFLAVLLIGVGMMTGGSEVRAEEMSAYEIEAAQVFMKLTVKEAHDLQTDKAKYPVLNEVLDVFNKGAVSGMIKAMLAQDKDGEAIAYSIYQMDLKAEKALFCKKYTEGVVSGDDSYIGAFSIYLILKAIAANAKGTESFDEMFAEGYRVFYKEVMGEVHKEMFLEQMKIQK